MYLTIVQMFKKTVPGHIFRGKRRLIKRVSFNSVQTLKSDYERQEANMLVLRHPYLTVEESSGHAKALNKTKNFIEKWETLRTMTKMKPHVTIEDRLNHLNVKNSWD